MRQASNKLSREPAIDGEDYAMTTRGAVIKAGALHLADLRREHRETRYPNRILAERSVPAHFSAASSHEHLWQFKS